MPRTWPSHQIKTRREMRGRKARRLDRFLHVHPEVDKIQEKLKRPLILLIAAGRAEGEEGFGATRRDRGGQRGARAFARSQSIGMSLIETEGLNASSERKAERVDHG